MAGHQDQIINLSSYIDIRHAECLNIDAKCDVKTLFEKNNGSGSSSSQKPIYSDNSTDAQLLIHIPFQQAIKLKSFRIGANLGKSTTNESTSSGGTATIADAFDEDENDEDMNSRSGPKTVKVFLNRNNLGFADAESEAPLETFHFTEDDLINNTEKRVKFVKYQNVQSLTFYIADNQQDSEVTALQSIEFFGTPVSGMNVNELKKQGDDD